MVPSGPDPSQQPRFRRGGAAAWLTAVQGDPALVGLKGQSARPRGLGEVGALVLGWRVVPQAAAVGTV